MTESGRVGVIDTEQLRTLAASAGLEAANAILDAFWNSNKDLVRLLAQGIARQDYAEVMSAAHALKGSASNVGAVELAGRAKRIELAARSSDLATVRGEFGKLANDILTAKAAFKSLISSIAA